MSAISNRTASSGAGGTAKERDQRKTVLITGCTPGGIGAALAIQFHRSGLRVFATARRPETLSPLSSLGIETFSLDVTSPISIQECFTHILSLTGTNGLDYLINNAGINYTVPALDIDITDLKEIVFETNLFGVMRMCSTFAPLLILAKGTIVMVGSVAGYTPYVMGSGYNASKAALHAYSNTLRVEMAPFEVDVLTVVTGGVLSNIATHHQRQLTPGSWYREINDVYQWRLRHSQVVGIPAEIYARDVVRQVLPARGFWARFWRAWITGNSRGLRQRWIWVGAKTGLVWFACAGWWQSLLGGYMDRWFRKQFSLDRLKAAREGIVRELRVKYETQLESKTDEVPPAEGMGVDAKIVPEGRSDSNMV